MGTAKVIQFFGNWHSVVAFLVKIALFYAIFGV